MLWLWAFAIPGILGVLGYDYQKFQCRHHQEMPYRQEFLLAMLIALMEASLNCLFLLLPLFAYQGYDETNLAELLLGFDLFLQALSPREIILSIHEKHRFPKFDLWKILQNSLFALVLLVELFLFNFKSFSEKAFLFSPLRFYGLGALVYLGLALLRLVLKPAAPSFTSRKPYFVLLGAAIVATLGFVLLVSLNASRYFTTYPFQQSDTNSNPFLYYNLFQAFKNGHVYLDDIPDSRLASLTNPYDPYARRGIPYLWDTAYYQGKYYCYYGPAPVILVMFPVYWLTGHVPTGLFLEVFALILYAFGFIYTSLRLNKLGKNPLPWPLWSLLTSVALLSSLSLNFVAYRLTDWKYILPFDFGLAFAVWFFGLVLTAYQSPSLRMLYLGMAGFFYVALMASRPDLGIVLLFSWPLLLKLLFMKDKAVGQRFLDFVPMVGILLVGAGLLIAYNVTRYGKITEFGQDYQLTTLDCSQQKMSCKGAVAGLLHYWFTPPKSNEYFPYYTMSQWPQADWDTHPYNIGAIGLLCVPFFYGMALAPRVCAQAKGWEQKTMYALLPLAPIMTSITIYCLGGVCARYLMGIWPLASLAALAILMRFLSTGQDSMVKKAIFYPLVYGACLFSIVMVFCVAFNSFSGLGLGQGGFLSKLVYDAFTF